MASYEKLPSEIRNTISSPCRLRTLKKVVLITGCSLGGIGYALAREFNRCGCHVYASARRLEAMDGLEELGISIIPLDVTSHESIQDAVKQIMAKSGRIDILVNNAGMGFGGPVAEVPLQDVRRLYETNLFGAVALAQAVFPVMASQKFGKIVNIGSVAGYLHRPWNFPYASSKAALHAATNCMRLEMKPFGIQVILVTPGIVRTNIFNSVSKTIKLEETSSYKSYEKAMYDMSARYAKNPKSTSPEEFSKKVVEKVLYASPWRIVYGRLSSLALLLSSMPMWFRDRILWRMYGKI